MSHFAKLIDLPVHGICFAFPHAHFQDRFSVLTGGGFEEFDEEIVEAFGVEIPVGGINATLKGVLLSPAIIAGVECLTMDIEGHGVLNSNDLRFYRRCDVQNNHAHRLVRQLDLTIHL